MTHPPLSSTEAVQKQQELARERKEKEARRARLHAEKLALPYDETTSRDDNNDDDVMMTNVGGVCRICSEKAPRSNFWENPPYAVSKFCKR